MPIPELFFSFLSLAFSKLWPTLEIIVIAFSWSVPEPFIKMVFRVAILSLSDLVCDGKESGRSGPCAAVRIYILTHLIPIERISSQYEFTNADNNHAAPPSVLPHACAKTSTVWEGLSSSEQ